MAQPYQIKSVPDYIRASYPSQDLNEAQMAKEVPRQYQRFVICF